MLNEKQFIMISNILQNASLQNKDVKICGQINASKRCLGNDSLVIIEALSALEKKGVHDYLNKAVLLELWKDDDISFAAKCLMTLWWGRPSHYVRTKVYSPSNIELLSNSKVEETFRLLCEESDSNRFKNGLAVLYESFCKGGCFCLGGIGVSFFTKFFHFYFASHPIKSSPGYLPVIADDIIRKAVFAEMIDNEEDVSRIFNTSNATLRSYVCFTDRFNDYAKKNQIEPFALEDILFNHSKGIGDVYLSSFNKRLCLPHWIAGRYNAEENIAIVFNNLIGETYLFDGSTAVLWKDLLNYNYLEKIDIEALCSHFQCSRFEILSFMKELVEKRIIMDHTLDAKELDRLKKFVNKSKSRFLKSNRGLGKFQSAFQSVDNDYRNLVSKHGIPFSMSFELTYACNEACIHCYNPNSPRLGSMGVHKIKPKGELTAEEYFPILDKMKAMGVAKIVFTGGDPFMKKDLMSILMYAHQLKFAFSVYTNGQALYSDDNLYNQLKALYPQDIGLSLYSTIPEVHDSITRRKGSCEKTMAVARRCYEDAISLQIKCPIMKANMNSYGGVYEFALSVNGMPQLDVNITSSVDGDCFASQRLRLTENQFMKVLKDNRIPLSIENPIGVVDRRPEYGFCGAGSVSFNIKPDGTLTPCCAYPVDCGNVKEKDLDELWKSSSQLLKLRGLCYKDSDICGKEQFCRYCNRCIGQSYVEHGIAENHSEDNCFIAKIRFKLAQMEKVSLP